MYKCHSFWLWVSMTWSLTSNKCRLQWPIFYCPVILTYTCILKCIWSINIILMDYETVWPNIWPQNKCRSQWPTFQDPVILPYMLKSIWCTNIMLIYYESVWPKFWPQTKCRSLWLAFQGQVIMLYILKEYWTYKHHTYVLWISMIRSLTTK